MSFKKYAQQTSMGISHSRSFSLDSFVAEIGNDVSYDRRCAAYLSPPPLVAHPPLVSATPASSRRYAARAEAGGS